MKYFIGFLFCFLACFSLFGQSHTWVFFTDKGIPERSPMESSPSEELDVSVFPAYLQGLRDQGWRVKGSSRWFNAAVIESEGIDPDQLMALPYVKSLRSVATFARLTAYPEASRESFEPIVSPGAGEALQYGRASFQNAMLAVETLHQQGLTGRGIRMAILDAGFMGADTIDAFDSLRIQGRIVATHDFVDDTSWVYHGHYHGTEVASTIVANLPGKMVGSAPHVSLLLARTENARSETQLEEHNFVAALEWADSLGVDILHASLGYSEFDQGKGSYTYEKLDGNTAITTRAVDIAASKGMMITVAAGNEGSGRWKYITVPCDADSALCIGSVDRYGKRSSFSSIGPTPDGRIKPDVVAMGSRAAVATSRNTISSNNGTSFSSPIVAGMVACLLQAHPNRSNQDLIQAIRMSADRYYQPDGEYGYGLPNARIADSLLRLSGPMQAPLPPGTKEVAEPKPVLPFPLTLAPKTSIRLKKKWILIDTKTAQADIRSFDLYQDHQLIEVPTSAIKQKSNKIRVRTQDLLPGNYQLRIVTDKFDEYIPFNLSVDP